MSVETHFETVARRLVAERLEVDQGRMLQAVGLRSGGKFFAYAKNGELVVKLPAARVAALVDAGRGEPLYSGGRVMREWVRLRPRGAKATRDYIEEARECAQAKEKR